MPPMPRGPRHRAVVAVLLALLALAALLWGLRAWSTEAASTPLTRAWFETECTGAGAASREATLPDVWIARGADGCLHARYRLRLPPAGSEPLWVFVPKVRLNAEFRLNGTLVWSGGRMDPPVTRHSTSPFFFMLPAALMRADDNELIVRVAAPGETGGLSVVHVGAYAALGPEVARRRLWQTHGVYATSAVVAATSLYILLTWLQAGRRIRGDLYLAICGAIWAARNLNLVWTDFPGSDSRVRELAELLAFSGHGWFMGFFGLFALSSYEKALSPRRARILRVGVVGCMLLGPVLYLAGGDRGQALTLWLVLVSPVAVVMAGLLLRETWRLRTAAAAGFVVAFVVLMGLGIYDNMTMVRAASFGNLYLTPYGGVALFVAIAQLLVARYGRLLRERDSFNASLGQRLAQREAELRASYDVLQSAERERAALAERARIMRDLHDGVGSMLLAAMHDVRQGVGAAELRRQLQSCLDDLRLAVDSLEPHANYPSTILGSLRYRLAPRLAEAGLRLRWDVDEVPPLAELDPSRALQLLRLLQEAIANVIRHARATELTIGLHRVGDAIEIVVRDDGAGFDPTAARRGHGLDNMQHRAGLLGASLAIDSGAGGTVLRLRLPAGAPQRSDDAAVTDERHGAPAGPLDAPATAQTS